MKASLVSHQAVRSLLGALGLGRCRHPGKLSDSGQQSVPGFELQFCPHRPLIRRHLVRVISGGGEVLSSQGTVRSSEAVQVSGQRGTARDSGRSRCL